MIRRPDSNLSTTSFRNEAWNSSASRLTSTTASEYTTPISKTGSVGESVRNDLGGYQEVHAINASEMYEGYGTCTPSLSFSDNTSRGVPNFRKRKELFDDSDASPSPTLSYRGSQFSPTAVAQQQIGCQHCLSRMVTSSFSETVHTFRRPRSSSVDYSDSQNHGKADSGWKWFVHASPDEDGKTIYSCQWAGCNSFKHLSNVKEKNYKTHKSTLIKRHIESTHMKLKCFLCDWPGCDKCFSQKSAMKVHRASEHTRDNPYKCNYKGCKRGFNDPARLHRHKKSVHNYIPRPRCHHSIGAQGSLPTSYRR
ncbi:hypothetical protein F5880DRAFT_589231 [Lentinula raphanica]|nr:hypothetical protein F5880DRAFT_589231 [Lentinula raphanica]